jgi:hypothetical protein
MASGKCIRGIEIDFFRKETNMRSQSGGNSSPSVKALVQESPFFFAPSGDGEFLGADAEEFVFP